MAHSLNRVQLIGNVGKDPEVRNTQSGGKIVNLAVATSERWKDKQSGEQRERTEWHKVVIFSDGLGSIVEQYVKKGSKIFIEGQLQTRKWTDQSGQERYSTEVVLQAFGGQVILLDGRGGGNAAPAEQQRGPAAAAPSAGAGGGLDDEIPF